MTNDEKRQVLQGMMDTANAEIFRVGVEIDALTAEAAAVQDDSTKASITQQIAINNEYQTRQQARLEILQSTYSNIPTE